MGVSKVKKRRRWGVHTRYQCRCTAAGGQRPRARGLHHPQHDRLRHGRPHRRPVRVVQCALQKFYSKGNMIG